MIELAEAEAHVLERCAPLDVVSVSVHDAHGLVTAREVCAGEPVPPFDNTAMDGFAVRAVDTEAAPVRLEIIGTLAAGARPDFQVGPGQAVRIMTGAPLPPGADAVIMVELTEVDGASVVATRTVPVGNHVRRAGEDVVEGQEVFAAGTELTPGHLGVLCSLGVTDVTVHRRPRVGVMSTGDELVEGGAPLEPGQIRESNRRTLLAMVAEAGCEPVDLGLAPDDEDAITSSVLHGVETCDALVSSGGVSMGDFDYVKVVLDRIGWMRWMQVAIKPAKPLAFGLVREKPVFGLPGNPVSSMVSFELFARPALRKMAGHRALHRPRLTAVVESDLQRRPDGKTHFFRVIAEPGSDGRYHVRSAGGQGSHQLHAMAEADALAVVPDGDGVPAGENVEIFLLR